jgi:hypothetical protein
MRFGERVAPGAHQNRSAGGFFWLRVSAKEEVEGVRLMELPNVVPVPKARLVK